MAWWARTFQITGEKHTIKLRPYNKKWSNKAKNIIKYNYRIKAEHIYHKETFVHYIPKSKQKDPKLVIKGKKKIVCSMSETPKIKWVRKFENKSLGKGMPGKYQQKTRNLNLSIKHIVFKAKSIQ